MFNSERFSSYNIPGFFGHRPTYSPAKQSHHPHTDHHLPTPPTTATSTTTSTKRTIGSDDLESEIPIDSNKRVKVELGNTAPELSIDQSVTPSTTDTTFLATPHSISGCAARATRSTAEDFMSGCAVNGLEACRPSTLEIISTPAPSDDFDRSGIKIGRLVNTNSTACTGSASNDGISNSSTHDGILSEVPAFPVEAIKILQQASTDMLRLLVKKNTPDRERQLQVAVGTMRTCLEVEFVPHLEAWTDTPVEKSVTEVVEGKAIGVTTGHPVPVSDKKGSSNLHVSVTMMLTLQVTRWATKLEVRPRPRSRRTRRTKPPLSHKRYYETSFLAHFPLSKRSRGIFDTGMRITIDSKEMLGD
jgi:hypothetical protein